MVVLAIMTVLFAVSLPMMRKPLAKSELVRAAQEVQAALADARLTAIESGSDSEFLYQLGSGLHRVNARRRPIPIQPSEPPATADTELASAGQPTFAAPAARWSASSETSASRFSGNGASVEQAAEELAGSIQFLSESQLEDRLTNSPTATLSLDTARESPANASDEVGQAYYDPLLMMGMSAAISNDWHSVRFFPDGSCESTEILLADNRYSVRIEIRGLTGGIRLGKPTLIQPKSLGEAILGDGLETQPTSPP